MDWNIKRAILLCAVVIFVIGFVIPVVHGQRQTEELKAEVSILQAGVARQADQISTLVTGQALIQAHQAIEDDRWKMQESVYGAVGLAVFVYLLNHIGITLNFKGVKKGG